LEDEDLINLRQELINNGFDVDKPLSDYTPEEREALKWEVYFELKAWRVLSHGLIREFDILTDELARIEKEIEELEKELEAIRLKLYPPFSVG